MSNVTQIIVTVLDGNLVPRDGVNDVRALADDYATRLEDALSEQYPGAEIDIRIQRNTEGAEPRPTALDSDGNDITDDHIDMIRAISERVFEATDWARF